MEKISTKFSSGHMPAIQPAGRPKPPNLDLGKNVVSSPRGFSEEMSSWVCRVSFFLFFRLLRALVEIRRLVGSVHQATSSTQLDIQQQFEWYILLHVFLLKITHLLQVLENQPDVESRQIKLPGYPQELGEVEKNKKKFTRHTQLDISLLKPRGEETTFFPKSRYGGFQVLGDPQAILLAYAQMKISSSKCFPFFSFYPPPNFSTPPCFGFLDSEVCEALWCLFCASESNLPFSWIGAICFLLAPATHTTPCAQLKKKR